MVNSVITSTIKNFTFPRHCAFFPKSPISPAILPFWSRLFIQNRIMLVDRCIATPSFLRMKTWWTMWIRTRKFKPRSTIYSFSLSLFLFPPSFQITSRLTNKSFALHRLSSYQGTTSSGLSIPERNIRYYIQSTPAIRPGISFEVCDWYDWYDWCDCRFPCFITPLSFVLLQVIVFHSVTLLVYRVYYNVYHWNILVKLPLLFFVINAYCYTVEM